MKKEKKERGEAGETGEHFEQIVMTPKVKQGDDVHHRNDNPTSWSHQDGFCFTRFLLTNKVAIVLKLAFTYQRYQRYQTPKRFHLPPPLPQGLIRLAPVKTSDAVTASFSSSRRGRGWGGLQSFVYLQTVRRGQTKQHPTGCYKQPTDSSRREGEGKRTNECWWCSPWRTGWCGEGRQVFRCEMFWTLMVTPLTH